MTGRGKLWHLLHDPDGQLHELDLKLDLIDAAIHDEHYLAWLGTKARLERLGIDASYSPPLRAHPSEQRTAAHIGPDDDVEAIVTAAQPRSKIDEVYNEWLASRSRSGEDFF